MFKNITAAFTLVLFILLHTWHAVAAEQKLLEDITFETPPGNEERITFKLNGVYIPKIFAIKGEKPRVVFDFPDINPARVLKNTINTNGKLVKRIRMGVHYEPIPKTRVVFDLLPDKVVDFKHDFDPKKNALIISVFQVGEVADSKPEAREEKKDVALENLEQAEKTVPAQKPEITKTLSAQKPGTTEPKETRTITSPPSAPVLPAAQISKEEVAPATKPETALASPAPKLPTVKQEETPIIPLTHSAPALPVTQPSWEEVAPAPQKPEKQAAAQQEEKQTPVNAEASETDKTTSPTVINSITFDNSSERGEMVLFKLNKFQPPTVVGVEEGLPKVVCDFKGAEAADDVPNIIKTDGKYVHTIRISKENTPKKVRVFLDLTSSKNYDLQQVFFKDDNLFVIIINTRSNMLSTGELKKPFK